MNAILDEIVAYKKQEVERTRSYFPLDKLKAQIKGVRPPRDFKYAVSGAGGPDAIRIIAEVKKASPSKGVLKADFYPYEIAKIYQTCGAVAVSVVTEERYFKGSLSYLTPIKNYLRLPVLRKDFIIDEYQVYETFIAGADAILLIAAILEKDHLKGLVELSQTLGMTPLVEVHSSDELKAGLEAGAVVIGINNRDLKTFKTDINLTATLAPEVPGDKILITESGIHTLDDIMKLKQAGAEAFLVGEALMTAPDIPKKLKELRGLA